MKPARSIIAKARPHPSGQGFAAQWAAPGLVPDWVYVRNGEEIQQYTSHESAVIDARRVVIETLNSRLRWRPIHRSIERMSAIDLSEALLYLELSPGAFAAIRGQPQNRVMKWLDGEEAIPHDVRVMVALMKLPGGVELASRTTREVTTNLPDDRNTTSIVTTQKGDRNEIRKPVRDLAPSRRDQGKRSR